VEGKIDNNIHPRFYTNIFESDESFKASKRSISRVIPLPDSSLARLSMALLISEEIYSSPQLPQILAGTFLKTSVISSFSRRTVV